MFAQYVSFVVYVSCITNQYIYEWLHFVFLLLYKLGRIPFRDSIYIFSIASQQVCL